MAIINYEITLDLVANNYVAIRAKQQDINTRRVIISCTMNGEKYTLSSGTSANIVMKKPDGHIVANPCQVDTAKNVVIADLTEQMLAVKGSGYAEIVLINASTKEVISTMSFVIVISESAHADAKLISSNEFKSLGQLTVTMEEIKKSLEGLDASVIDAEKQRQQNETARVSAENARNAAEQQRVSAENTRKAAETQRDNAEKLRASAEQKRAADETTRASQESGRVNAENTRAANERTRVSSESQRVNVEKARVSAESARAAAETKRGQDEQARKTAETTRVQQEDARKAAEQSRVNVEKQRVTAEQARETKEQQRNTAEQGRVSAESTRVTAEQGRVAAEKGRVSAEDQRVAAEKIRVANENRRLAFDNVKSEGAVSFHSGVEQVVQPKLYGKSTQVVTKGYQLFDASKLPTTSKEGATLTNHGDGSFTISGSGNVTNIFSVIYEYPKEEALKLLKVGALKLNNLSETRPYFIFGLANVNGAVASKHLSNNPGSSIKQFDIIQNDIEKIKTGEYKLKLWFFSSTNSPIVGGTIKPMVYYDGDGTWEPFTGGKPGPSPDYPQEIVNKEVSEVKATGKNLLNYNDFKNDSYYSVENNTVIPKKEDSRAWSSLPVTFRLKKGKYVFRCTAVETTNMQLKNLAEALVGDDVAKINCIIPNKFFIEFEVLKDFEILRCKLHTPLKIALYKKEYDSDIFEPYKEQIVTLTQPITLRGIKGRWSNVTINNINYMSDIICEKNGVIGVERNTGIVVVDGVETKFIDKNQYWNLPINSAKNISSSDYMDMYFGGKPWSTNTTYGFIFVASTTMQPYFATVDLLNEFCNLKNIEGNPLIIYFVKTPTFEPLPQVDQDKFKTLIASQGQANLFANAFIDLNHIVTTDYALPYPIYSESEVDAKSNLISKVISGTTQNEIIVVPLVPCATIDPTRTEETYLKEWLKWICTNYPKTKGKTFIGAAAPNAAGMIMARIYDTNEVNSSGYPRYANFVYYPLPSAVSDFITGGFNNYVWTMSTYNLNSLAIKGHNHDTAYAPKLQTKQSIDSIKNDLDINIKMQRTGKLYGVKKWKSATNPISTCEKLYDNVGLVCEPSTDITQGRDDYANIALFQWHRVNYKRYDDGFAYPVAWQGDKNYNDKDNADVGNLYQTFYYNEIDKGDYTELIISDSPNKALGLRPWEEAVRADGTVMPYFIMSAFEASKGSDGLLHSLPNRQTVSHVSHNSMITDFQKKGKGYWGAGSNRFTFLQIMSQIKYGTKDIQSIMTGCVNYQHQIKASVQSATKQTYFPILKTDKDKFIAGACVSVGYGTVSNGNINLDRNLASMNKYADRVKILKLQDLDGTNAAVYLDCQPFDTMPISDPSGKQLEITISIMPWWSGTTDKVIGHHDGSWMSNTNSRMPFRLQGIECFLGRYVVASDTVMFFNADHSKDVYFAPRGVAHTTNDTLIKQTYTKLGTIPACSDGKGSDYWVGDVTIKNGVWYPSSELSTQQSYKDRLYAGSNATSGSREYLQGGPLGDGSGAGSAFLDCGVWLGWAVWSFACAD